MRRSEYIAQRRMHWMKIKPGMDVDGWVLRDVGAAEAAGVVWDKEEPELPTRISHDQGCFTDAETGQWLTGAQWCLVRSAMIDAYNDWGSPHGERRRRLNNILHDMQGSTKEMKMIRALLEDGSQ